MMEGPDLLRAPASSRARGPSRQGLAILDPKALIAEAISRMASPLRTPTVVAATFIPLYCGEWGQDLVDQVLALKGQQSIGGMRHLKDALRALSVEELVKPGYFNQGSSK
jgi:hypothetical protein